MFGEKWTQTHTTFYQSKEPDRLPKALIDCISIISIIVIVSITLALESESCFFFKVVTRHPRAITLNASCLVKVVVWYCMVHLKAIDQLSYRMISRRRFYNN